MNAREAVTLIEYQVHDDHMALELREAVHVLATALDERDLLADVLSSRDKAIHEATSWMDRYAPITARIDAIRALPALLAERERLRRVAEWLDIGESLAGRDSNDLLTLHFTVGQIRYARAALAGKEPQNE